MSTLSIGHQGEELVLNKLLKDGFKLVTKNYRKRFGEIDLIVSKDKLLVFVEVKLRRSNYFDLSEIVTLTKQKRIIKAAKDYISRNINFSENKILRFDVALVQKTINNFDIHYIPNAFTASNNYY